MATEPTDWEQYGWDMFNQIFFGPLPVGWSIKINLEPRPGGYALVARCSCGRYDSFRDGTPVGEHIEAHLEKFEPIGLTENLDSLLK